jgi:adenylate cyclase
MISEKNKLNLQLLGVIIISWMAFMSLVFLYEYISLKIRFPQFYEDFSPGFEYLILMVATFIAGIIGGSILVFNIRKKSENRPFYYGILMTVIYFLFVYMLISILTSFIVFSFNLGLSPLNKEVLHNVYQNVTASHQLQNIFLWLFILASTQFFVQINDKFGPGNLWKLIKGTYYNPKEELRVFMFLDIKSSTAIAEKLGHKKYYLFLNDFFAEITDPIIDRKGEIYQYVGDEIVISWELEKAIQHMNCLNCFFEIRDKILEKESNFEWKYGIKPEFKAGIHFGPVTAGEIGIIKRDIIFTGDVLNTTSRIQASCNELDTDILLSDNVLSLFDKTDPFIVKALGKITLKGKLNTINISTLSRS